MATNSSFIKNESLDNPQTFSALVYDFGTDEEEIVENIKYRSPDFDSVQEHADYIAKTHYNRYVDYNAALGELVESLIRVQYPNKICSVRQVMFQDGQNITASEENSFQTTTIIDEDWSNYDKMVANSHLADFGFIVLDEYGCPVDNEYDLEEFYLAKDGKKTASQNEWEQVDYKYYYNKYVDGQLIGSAIVEQNNLNDEWSAYIDTMTSNVENIGFDYATVEDAMGAAEDALGDVKTASRKLAQEWTHSVSDSVYGETERWDANIDGLSAGIFYDDVKGIYKYYIANVVQGWANTLEEAQANILIDYDMHKNPQNYFEQLNVGDKAQWTIPSGTFDVEVIEVSDLVGSVLKPEGGYFVRKIDEPDAKYYANGGDLTKTASKKTSDLDEGNTMEHTNDERYEYLHDIVGAGEEVLVVVLGINGDAKETYDDLLYFFTGERDIDAAIDEYIAYMED